MDLSATSAYSLRITVWASPSISSALSPKFKPRWIAWSHTFVFAAKIDTSKLILTVKLVGVDFKC
ncbi:hypothetical protein V6Z12_A08G124600 [Gossypium hirsutum]